MPRLTSEEQHIVEDYLHGLRRKLDDLPRDERQDLLDLAQAEIELQLDNIQWDDGEALRTVLRSFGEPASYAERLRAARHPEAAARSRPLPRGLTPCRTCGGKVSMQAYSCPHCGAPWPARREWQGWGFEWKSKTTLFGIPLVHIAVGRDANRRLRVAKGIIAIGQFAIGAITIAQFGIGFLFGLGQFIFAPVAIAQIAVGLLFGLGQFATGYLAVGQFALGWWVRCQIGWGRHLWSQLVQDPAAVEFFRRLLDWLGFGRPLPPPPPPVG